MKNKFLINLIIFVLINTFIFSGIKAQINNSIVVKVGDSIVSSIDVQNQIMTNLFLTKTEITQENINNIKNRSVKFLINKSIKRSEINKYEIKNYNKKDLANYIEQVAKRFSTTSSGLKTLFSDNKLDYETFVEQHKVELLWNTLIFKVYNNQININVIEVENDITILSNTETYQYNLSEIEISNTLFNEKKKKKIMEKIKNKGLKLVAKKLRI